MKPKIICVHLLNDYSGSPLVLSQAIQAFVDRDYEVTVCTNQTQGFLSDIEGAKYKRFNYHWSNKRYITMLRFFWCQLLLFFKMFQYRKEEVVFYVNTILPFGVALAGKLMNKKVVYHVHETSIKPAIFKNFLFGIANYSANEAIYVSHYLKENEGLKNVPCQVIYNALPKAFTDISEDFKKRGQEQDFNILMLCSLKRYKGINEFIEVTQRLPQYQFHLVINSDDASIENYLKDFDVPNNLFWYPAQSNVHPFYQKAHLVMNLSHPEMWVETFGMTALEAMSYRLPVIVPPVGGIAEVVEDGVSGYQIDCRNIDEIINCIQQLANNQTLYQEVAQQAHLRSQKFSIVNMSEQVNTVIVKNEIVSKWELSSESTQI